MRLGLVVRAVAATAFACGLLSDPALAGHQSSLNTGLIEYSTVDVYVKGPNGALVKGQIIVTLSRVNGQIFNQDTAKEGHIKFVDVPESEYKILVFSPAYQSVSKDVDIRRATDPKFTIELQPLGDAEDVASAIGLFALPAKVQKNVGKALEALRTDKPSGALSHLEAARRIAPNSAEIEYLFGVYSSKSNDAVHAREHWMKTLELNPRHLGALLSVGEDLLREKKSAEALPYLKRAIEVEPSAWRGHALLGEAFVLETMFDEATTEAQRAIELGHDRASSAQLILVRVHVEKNEKDQAVQILEAYVKAHPGDKGTANYLDHLKNPEAAGNAGSVSSDLKAVTAEADALPSNWLPPDVDASVPVVEPGASCSMDDVVKKAGQRILELVTDVDRFTATESVIHESIGKYGMPSPPEKRRFNYVVSIQEVQHSFLNVEELRNTNGLPAEFPGGVATNGLPALVLIFHPFNIVNFDTTCEGLARTSSGFAWQVHFKQRADKPNTIRRYRIGAQGPSYPVALKGRAWISADTFQIVRLETDLVQSIPQIKLFADHTAIEYGPVKFHNGQVNLWLPQSAEIYYDWRGRRIHRRHSFSNYLLFGVDDRQKISAPKVQDVATDGGANGREKKNRSNLSLQ
jgi:tetratricopeptide (TPR) repeat protein